MGSPLVLTVRSLVRKMANSLSAIMAPGFIRNVLLVPHATLMILTTPFSQAVTFLI